MNEIKSSSLIIIIKVMIILFTATIRFAHIGEVITIVYNIF